MTTTFPSTDSTIIYVLFATSLILAASPAQASYTVIDDDLYPTAVVEARVSPPPISHNHTEHFTIPFAKDYTPLTYAGRSALENLLPQMRDASIRIVGRPDAMTYREGRMSNIPRNRAINMRDYLTRQGIPASSITIVADNTPNPQPNGYGYPSDIYITHSGNQFPSQYPALNTPSYATKFVQPESTEQPLRNPIPVAFAPTQVYAPAQPIAPQPTTVPGPMNSARDHYYIQYINQSVQSGEMSPAVALKLLRTLMESDPNYAAQLAAQQQPVQNALPPPPPPKPEPLFVATPALVRKETWKLDKALTLRENVDAWSKLAGWNPSVWDASNFFEVKRSSTLEGGFPDILRQIADNTGLNICAKKHEKYVRVTDSTVSCKD